MKFHLHRFLIIFVACLAGGIVCARKVLEQELQSRAEYETQFCRPFGSLRGRRLKGKGKGVLGKGVLGARETRPSAFAFCVSRFSLSLPFQTPATQASHLGHQGIGNLTARFTILGFFGGL